MKQCYNKECMTILLSCFQTPCGFFDVPISKSSFSNILGARGQSPRINPMLYPLSFHMQDTPAPALAVKGAIAGSNAFALQTYALDCTLWRGVFGLP